MPPPKSARTCTQCRARKVRCDGGPNPCSNCERLSFSCSFATSRSPSHPERRRGSRACVQCRSQKTKCSGELPACAVCRSRDKACVYPDVKRPARPSHRSPSISNQSGVGAAGGSPKPLQPHQPPPSDVSTGDAHLTSPSITAALPMESNAPLQPSPELSSSWRGSITGLSPNEGGGGARSMPLPPMRDRLQLIIDFFRHVHPLPSYAFLNEVSITQRCLDGSLDETLLLALCATSSLHLKYSKYHPTLTTSWIKRAEDIIWSQIEQPTIFRTQALLLIVHYRIESGSFQRAYMLMGIAGRAASALRLQYERIDLGPLAQEIRRRIMWCIMLLNCSFSIGLPESEVCSPDSIYVRLPCNEEDFHAENDESIGNDPLSLDGICEKGLLATSIRETLITRDIIRLMRQVRLSSQPMPQLPDLVDEFARMLQQLPIPPYSAQELNRFASSRWLVRYLTVQLSWHQAHCDAYRLFLSGYREAAPEVVLASYPQSYIAMAARTCLYHAQANITILDDFSRLAIGTFVAHDKMAVCGYHACRLMLFLSRSTLIPSDSNLTTDAACHQASAILTLFQRLYKDSALVRYILKDLEALIQSYAAGETDYRRDSSEREEYDNHQARFAVTVRKHKSLGVHSVLRRAGFVDDSAEAGVPCERPQPQQTITQSDSLGDSHEASFRMTSQQSVVDPGMDEGHLAFDVLMKAAMLPSPLASNFEGPQLTIPSEPFTLGPWDTFNDWSFQGNFSPRSDADYL